LLRDIPCLGGFGHRFGQRGDVLVCWTCSTVITAPPADRQYERDRGYAIARARRALGVRRTALGYGGAG
jgi:hypothetical protein